MPLPRFDKLDHARKEAILNAARAEFAVRGFAGASYNAIIRDAGLSKGAMYYYFTDKADLCRTVIERVLVQMAAASGELGDFEDAEGFWIEVTALARRATEFALAMPEIASIGRLLYGEGSSSEVLEPLLRRTEAWCMGLLEQGQRVGAVRVDLPLSLLAAAVTGTLAHTDRWLARHLDALEPEELERLLSLSCLELVERLVCTPERST